MIWAVEFSETALKHMKKLDRPIRERILLFCKDKLIHHHFHSSLGKILKGPWKSLMRFRVGDYRLICRMEEEKLLILVLEVGHRRDVYVSHH